MFISNENHTATLRSGTSVPRGRDLRRLRRLAVLACKITNFHWLWRRIWQKYDGRRCKFPIFLLFVRECGGNFVLLRSV